MTMSQVPELEIEHVAQWKCYWTTQTSCKLLYVYRRRCTLVQMNNVVSFLLRTKVVQTTTSNRNCKGNIFQNVFQKYYGNLGRRFAFLITKLKPILRNQRKIQSYL